MPERTAEAQWEGNFQQGRGTMKFDAWEGPYSFSSRFEEGQGTNPEELIGAAHAGCFSMQFASLLANSGHTPNKVHTTATVHIVKDADGFTITEINLKSDADVPGIDETSFQDIANQAKITCPVSRALSAVPRITLEAALTGQPAAVGAR